ncbi:dihydrolipoamide acetyltransferase family protein [Hoeflea sp.]|uniref:dihydrolipoamide acetyltransferase family protein n=1 Tax=Hoeflea sp. TaxID=1940281 RepID=UPI0019868619|nr:dihydrolipoamide acetyltransferase family protein [Hoeflea sp.]MBC7283782.1 2-oxo acid dehydrogenase subunit E2 [Hoeflea sp.]
MAEFRMPSLGADMEAGTLVEWLVKPGAPLKRGDVIAVVETQKGAIEIENFEEGVFERPIVEVGARVPVGAPIALIRRPDEAPAAAPSVAAPSAPEHPPEAPVSPQAAEPATGEFPPVPAALPPIAAGPATRSLHASPAARVHAQKHGIDLATITGTGPHGEIQLRDLEGREGPPDSIAAPAVEPEPQAMTGMRAAIAAAMARSKREIPHYYLAHGIDLTAAEAWLSNFNAGRDPSERVVLGAVFVKAVARAMRKYPEFNGHYADGVFTPSPVVHAGVAINIRGTGLVAPAIHDADALDIPELMAAMRDLVGRVRAGRFRSSELSDPTITISSLGDRGVEVLYGVIYPPQVAIVGFGMPVTEVRAAEGMIGPRTVVHVTLAGDHRVSDGHRGALFLSHIDQLLQKPEGL